MLQLKDPATLSNQELLVAYATTVLLLPQCKKQRRKDADAYGKALTAEILRRMGDGEKT